MDDVHQLTFRWKESQSKLEEREIYWRETIENKTNESLESQKMSLSTLLRNIANVKSQFSKLSFSVKK